MSNMQDLKILLVEDDLNARKALNAMLNEIGITQVFEGEDGEKAQKFLDEKVTDLDLIISDWNMPRKNGAALLRDIRRDKPDLPFIMITGRADMNSVKDAADLGVSAYIRKPFSVGELEEKVKAVLKYK